MKTISSQLLNSNCYWSILKYLYLLYCILDFCFLSGILKKLFFSIVTSTNVVSEYISILSWSLKKVVSYNDVLEGMHKSFTSAPHKKEHWKCDRSILISHIFILPYRLTDFLYQFPAWIFINKLLTFLHGWTIRSL